MYFERITTSGGGGGGYTTIEENGVPLPQETALNFIGAAASVTDNAGTSTNVTFAQNLNDIATTSLTKGMLFTSNGTNIVPLTVGTNDAYLVADSTQTDGIRWESAYNTVEEEASALPQRAVLNFEGAAVTAVDDGANNRTNIIVNKNVNDIAGLTPTANSVISGNGTHFVDTVLSPGGIFYVSAASGSDATGNGSVAFPYASIGKAVSVASANTAILIEGGLYTESINFAGISALTLQAIGGTDYGSVFITGTQSFTSTSNHITFIGISFSNASAAMATINAAAHISFQACVFNASAATNPAITITGSITGEMIIRDCLITGTVSNAATAFFQVYLIGQQSTACNVTASNGATIVLNCANLGLVTHSGGIIELQNIVQVTATAGNSVTSTANAAATNQFIMNNTSLQQNDLSYGTLVKSGTCIFVIASSNYNPATTFTGARANFAVLASDMNANYTPVHYTATDGSVTGNLHGIDNALASASGGISWSVKTTNTAIVKNNGYFSNGSGLVFTLPATAAVGDTFRISNIGTSFSVAQNAAQSIQFGNQATTSGITGSLASTSIGDSLEIVCNQTNNGFIVISSMGNITVT
jgi:hypothetical protein